ncbi:MAG: dTDP-glucose 4,6-dehydratase [Myxococcota bacterium]|jgi:dTDP-glucose 4,6-dehydratase|nr:dTDP-glucose 4,6-dehydratase [Myxococcota bacterium]
MHLLVTGGCGFIGSAFVAWLRRERPAWRLTVVDALTYAGRRENLAGLLGPDCVLVEGDVADPAFVTRLFAGLDPAPAALVHFAAETHVDRSLTDPIPFVRTNVMGTSLLLDAWRALGAGRFVQISTDEVYGALLPGEPPCDERQPLRPTNPYAATKAAADLLVLAGHRSFGLDALIVRSTNTYGPRQLPEKLIPRLLVRALTGQPLPIYGAGRAVRDWLHVDDAVRGILAVLEGGRAGEVYHLAGEQPRAAAEVAAALGARLGLPATRIVAVPDRPAHDQRYALDLSKTRRELGWEPTVPFSAGLAATIDWYLGHRDWWEPLRDRAD